MQAAASHIATLRLDVNMLGLGLTRMRHVSTPHLVGCSVRLNNRQIWFCHPPIEAEVRHMHIDPDEVANALTLAERLHGHPFG